MASVGLILRKCPIGVAPQRFQGLREVFRIPSFGSRIAEQEWNSTSSTCARNSVGMCLGLVCITIGLVLCRYCEA